MVDWLTNLKRYSKIKDYTLTDEEIEIIWDTAGGSVWEIQYLLSKRFDNDTKTICEDYKIKMRIMIIDYATENNRKMKEQVLKKFCFKNIISKSEFLEAEMPYLREMVHNNILYFNPVMATFYPQGKSTEWGIKFYFEEIGNAD